MAGYDVAQALGPHEVSVESHQVIEEEGGKLIVSFRLKFEDGEIGNKDFFPLASEKSLEITRKALRAMGFDIDKTNLSELQANQRLLSGVKVQATVEEHEYNGKISNRISWINPIKKPAQKKLMDLATQKLRSVKKENAEEVL
jgi:hypothetical protein